MKKVLVVGGGSAGWIAATYLDFVINGRGPKGVEITVVESESIGRIGVGEATVPTIRETIKFMGIDEKEFMKATGATYKHGILFENWQSNGTKFFHPFDRCASASYIDRFGSRWLYSDGKIPFADSVSAQPALARAGKSPKTDSNASFQAGLTYAYHMDAEAFANYLADLASSRGVKRIIETVETVATSGKNIQSLQLSSGQTISADLYIDCTGFAALLAGKALKGSYLDYSDWLLCDSAITLRVPYERCKTQAPQPYTTASAMSAGWCWDIGLQNRKGIGYVYASKFLSDDAAESELRNISGINTQGLEARRLKFKVGRLEQAWQGNCIAIGLSCGFLEPLESTGLFFVEYAARLLVEHFPYDNNDMEILAKRFNQAFASQYQNLMWLIVLHYCLSKRSDTPFWREVQKAERIPEELKEMLALWEIKLPSISDFPIHGQLFSFHNYEYILYGMGWSPKMFKHIRAQGTGPLVVPSFIQEAIARGMSDLLSHKEALDKLSAINRANN